MSASVSADCTTAPLWSRTSVRSVQDAGRASVLRTRVETSTVASARRSAEWSAGAALLDVDRAGVDEPGMAIDSGAGVLAQVRLVRVVHAHGDEVRPATEVKIRSEVVGERGEAVGPRAKVLTLIQTSLHWYTPSNCSRMRRPSSLRGSWNDLRYQPMPVGR